MKVVPTGVDHAALRAHDVSPMPPANASSEELKDLHAKREAARAFEAIFVRKMLSALEKTAGPGQAGGGIYASMMTSSLADAVSKQGGIGMSDMILRALQGAEPKK